MTATFKSVGMLSLPLTSSSQTLAHVSKTNAEKNEAATRAARKLLGQFRRGDANDAATFVTSVAAVLARYPQAIIDCACDPRTGLALLYDWLPTIRQANDFCNRKFESARHIEEREIAVAKQLADRAAMDAAAAARPTLDELRERHGPNSGLMGVCAVEQALAPDAERERERREACNARAAAKAEAAILGEYARLGREPVYAGEMLVSPALFKALGRPMAKAE